MKPKYWLVLGVAVAGAAQSTACSSSFHSCNDSRTCIPSGGASTRGEAGEGGAAGDTNAASGSRQAGAAGDSDNGGQPSVVGESGAGGDAGESANTTPDAGEGGEAGSVGAVCEASVDLKTDPKNCGGCGHDCLGGECEFGKCLPVDVATNQIDARDLATDGSYIFWSAYGDNGRHVARRRVDGADSIKIIAPAELAINGLTVLADAVYWLGSASVRTCSAPDCVGSPSDFKATAGNSCEHVVATSTALFWSCSAEYDKQNGAFWSVALSTSASSPTQVQPASTNPTAIVSSSDSVYWVNSSTYTQDVRNSDGAVWRLKLSTGATTKLASSIALDLDSVAVGNDRVYFSTYNAIYYVPLPNGAAKPTKFADVLVRRMVADERGVYWTSDSQGAVFGCPHSGCDSPETIAAGQTNPGPLTQDSESIYWSSLSGTNPIRRLAK